MWVPAAPAVTAVIGEGLGDLEIDVLDHDDGVAVGVGVLVGGDGRRLVIVPALVVAGTS